MKIETVHFNTAIRLPLDSRGSSGKTKTGLSMLNRWEQQEITMTAVLDKQYLLIESVSSKPEAGRWSLIVPFNSIKWMHADTRKLTVRVEEKNPGRPARQRVLRKNAG